AAGGVAAVGVAGPEHEVGVGLEGLADPTPHEHAAEGLVPGRDALRERDQIGFDAEDRRAPPAPEAAEPADDLVEDEQRAVLVAEAPEALEVAGLGGSYPAGADDRLGDHRRDLVAALLEEPGGAVERVVLDG